MTGWQLEAVAFHAFANPHEMSPKLAAMLEDGWEPFAVDTRPTNNTVIWLRRRCV